MRAKEVVPILKEKGVNYLYHANSVRTSYSYLELGGLYSRGVAFDKKEKDKRYYQTPQRSDQKDKELGILYDIFFDGCDIHDQAHNWNQYGPILFCFSVDTLLNVGDYDVGITRSNPAGGTQWDLNAKEEDRYFLNQRQLRQEYKNTNFGNHITIRNISEIIKFENNLKKIIIEKNYLNNMAQENVKNIICEQLRRQNLINQVDVILRECENNCNCITHVNCEWSKNTLWWIPEWMEFTY